SGVDRTGRSYSQTRGAVHVRFQASARDLPRAEPRASAPSHGAPPVSDAQREADRILLDRYAPACAIITEETEILQFRGHTGPYLEPAPGQASLNLLKMARQELSLELRALVRKASKDGR